MSKCGPACREEFYCEEEDLVIKDCCNDRAQLRLSPDYEYPKGTLVMENPKDPLSVIPWDGSAENDVCGLVTCDVLTFLDPTKPCPQQGQIGGRINPRAVRWPVDVSVEQIMQMIAQPKKGHCFIFQGMLENCAPSVEEKIQKYFVKPVNASQEKAATGA